MSLEKPTEDLTSIIEANPALFKATKSLEYLGFSPNEAADFATLEFKFLIGEDPLNTSEEERLAEYKEKHEELTSKLFSNDIVANTKKFGKMGFSDQEAARFASLQFRSTNPNVTLFAVEKEELTGYEERYKKNIVKYTNKFQGLGFEEAEEFACLIHKYKDGNISKKEKDKLEEYLNKYKSLLNKLPSGAKTDSDPQKPEEKEERLTENEEEQKVLSSPQPSPDTVVEDKSEPREKQKKDDKFLKEIQRKLMSGEHLTPQEEIIVKKYKSNF